MAFTVTGVATVSDVRDGVSPPTIYLTNENHTFSADASSVISDFTGFSSEVQVFVGSTQYTYSAVTPTGTQYTIGTPTVSTGSDLAVTVSASGAITISDAGTANVEGFADGAGPASATVTIPITVSGFSSTFNRVISFSKAAGGSAPIIRVASNTQTVEFDSSGSLVRTDDIVISATEINFTESGTVTFTYRAGATGNFIALAGNGVTIDNTATPETATITAAGFNTLLGTNRSITIRATRGSAFDQITIARVNDGAAAVTVIVAIESGSFILRSDTDAVTLRADVYVSGTVMTPGADWTYAWSKDGTALSAANQAAMTGATQGAGQGFDQRQLLIEGDGITDGGASLFSVTVTDPS